MTKLEVLATAIARMKGRKVSWAKKRLDRLLTAGKLTLEGYNEECTNPDELLAQWRNKAAEEVEQVID